MFEAVDTGGSTVCSLERGCQLDGSGSQLSAPIMHTLFWNFHDHVGAGLLSSTLQDIFVATLDGARCVAIFLSIIGFTVPGKNET